MALAAYTWVPLPTDETTALAVVSELAQAFELRPIKPGHWRIHSVGTLYFGDLVVRRDDAGSVSLGLRFEEPVDDNIGCVMGLLSLILGLMLWGVAVLLLARLSPVVAFALTLVWLMLPAVTMFKVKRALQLRRLRRVSGGWRDQFMRVLADRLAPGPTYR